MLPNSQPSPPVFLRRRARRLAVWNGAVWAIGNGLASTTLVVYLAKELRAEWFGVSIGLLVAAPSLAGLLRLAAPLLIECTGRKRFCAASFTISALTLSALPWLRAPGWLPSPGWSLTALVLLWCVYHLLQYLGTVALWSWLADAAQTRIRGRFLGVRQRWMVAGTAAAAIDVGLFVWGLSYTRPNLPEWLPYGVAAGLGSAFMLAAVVPLILMPPLEKSERAAGRDRSPTGARRPLRALLAPLVDRRFLPLLLFGCWFSLFNGVTQSAQHFYPIKVLGVPLLVMLSMQTGMRLGQWAASPRFGALADRFGNRPVMIVCQLVVGGGMLFYAAASVSGNWTWLIGGWALWIAYAGMNVCLPILMLKLSPRRTNASYIAAFDATRGLCYAAASIAGGALVDCCGGIRVSIGVAEMQFLTYLFLFGWAARSLGAAILWLVKEQP